MTAPIVDGLIDRGLGAVLGSACGDALGAGYEFTNPGPGAVIDMVGGGVFGWEPGEWTDDTQMALGILDVLAERCDPAARGSAAGWPVDVEAIGMNFLAWAASGPADIGNQTAAVLYATDNPADLAAMSAAYQDSAGNSIGNGGLMRTAPVALAALHDRDVLAALASDVTGLTHAHANSVAACVLWSEAIRRAVVEANPNESFDFAACIRDGLDLVDGERREQWSKFVEEAVEGPPTIFNPNGWVVTAFQAALSAIVHTPVPEDEPSKHLVDALEAAIRIGHDTDTVAAIAGGLLGARWGASAVPDRWQSILHGRRRSGESVVEAIDLEALTRRAMSGY